MKRKLRILVGEFLVETGEMIRDIGGFILPDYEKHPAFVTNEQIKANAVTTEKLRANIITNKKLR